MRTVVVFDVIETMLDLSPLDRHFRRAFGDKSWRSGWFAQMLQLAMTMSASTSWGSSDRPPPRQIVDEPFVRLYA